MPVLTGLVTYLALSGTPGLYVEYANKTEDTAARTYTADFTRLSAAGVPGRPYGSFAGKLEASEDAKSVTDSYVPVVTFGQFDSASIRLTDTYKPVVTMTATVGLGLSAIDTYIPRVTLGVSSLSKSGTTPIPSADSYVPVVTLGTSVSAVLASADDYVPVVTLGVTLDTSDAIAVTDDYVPVVDFNVYLVTNIANVDYSILDTYSPRVTLSAQVNEVGEVDSITITERACGLIRIEEA